MALKQKLSILFFLILVFRNGQSQKKIPLEPYFNRIEKLVDKCLSEDCQDFTAEKLIGKRKYSWGKDRIEACLDLFVHYIYKSTEIAKRYNDEAYRLSVEGGHKEGYLQASLNQAYILFVEGEFEKSMALILEVESDSKLSRYPEIEVNCETIKSYIFTERGEYDTALETAVGLLERGENLDEPYTLMRAYSAVSHVYLRLGEYQKALDNCLKGIDYILQLNKVRYIFPKIDEIARMTHKLEGSKKALKIYEFYLDIENKIGSPGGYIQSVVYMNIADIYTEESEFGKAENFLNRALTLIDTNNYRFRKPRAHVQLAELYLRTGDIPKAIDNYLMAFDASKSIDAFDVVKNASASLAELYTSTGDTTLASSFAAMHTSVSDSLFSIETNQRIKILEARRKISEISREKEILEIRSNSQEERYRLLLVIFMLTVVSSCVVAYSYYKAKKKNQLLYHRTKDLAIEKIKKRKMIIHGNTEHPDISDHPKSSETTYMDEDLKNIILAKLERYEEKQFFLDPKCSLGTLSDELQTNQKYLSQVINNEKKSNFNNYINGLRINYLLDRLIEDPEFRNSKLGYIARASGFNNSNTFYSAFKKRLGILPSYFIKQLNEEEV